MTRAEKFIQDYTNHCSNELEGGGYHEWLTPKQARRAVEIARDEMLKEFEKERDERIKKVIKQVLSESTTEKDECYSNNRVTQQEVFAWLEKKGDIIENNMLLPFKEYDNLMDSINNKKKKEGYEAGYKQGLIDSKNDQHVQPKFKVGDTISVKSSSAEYVITDIYGGYYHGKGWCLDIISADRSGDYELVEQKPAWSEEDEDYRQYVNAAVDNYFDVGLAKELRGWLYSLKERAKALKYYNKED